jgi:hypothetical protein
MLGVGIRSAPVAPVVVPAPGREPTLLGVGREPKTDALEHSLAIDLVSKKISSARPPPAEPAPPPAPEPSPEPARVEAPDPFPVREPEPATAPRRARPTPEPVATEPPDEEEISIPGRRRRSGAGWLVLLLLLAAGGAAGYVCRARVLPIVWTVRAEVAKRLH